MRAPSVLAAALRHTESMRLRGAALATFALISAAPSGAVDYEVGDLFIASGDGWGALFHADRASGASTVSTVGETLVSDPWGIVYDPFRDRIYLGDELSPRLVAEDPATGARTTLSYDGGQPVGSGAQLEAARDTLVEPDGTIVVLDVQGPAVLTVDPVSGDRAVLSSPSVGTGPAPTHLMNDIARAPDGSLLVVDRSVSVRGVIRIDRATGDRSTVSSNTIGTGPPFTFPSSIASDSAGTLFVSDLTDRHILEVDPLTGDRTVVSSDTVGSGPLLAGPFDVVVDLDGDLLVLDAGPRLIHVDRATGDRTILSSASVGSGPFPSPATLAVEATGDVLVGCGGTLLRIDPSSGDRVVLASSSVGSGANIGTYIALEVDGNTAISAINQFVSRVDLATGNRDYVSLFAYPSQIGRGAGPAFGTPLHMLLEHHSSLLVTDSAALFPPPYPPRIMRVQIQTGNRSIVSSDSVGAGPDWIGPAGLTRGIDGRIFVVDAGHDAVLQLDPETGDRAFISGQGVGPGVAFVTPIGIATEPSGTLVVADPGLPGLVRVNPWSGRRTILSGPGVGTGPAFSVPTEVTVDHFGGIWASDYGVQGFFLVVPENGNRVLRSTSLGVARGIAAVLPPQTPPQVPALPLWGALALGAALLATARTRRRTPHSLRS